MSGPRVGGMEVEHIVHPEIKKYHKSYSTSPADLREAKAQGKQACAVYGNLAHELRRCGKCQQADWPTHKLGCSADDSGLNMTKIAQTLNASTFLSTHLQMAFITAFDLLRDPCLDHPFAARIDIGVEPTDIMDFLRIYSGGSPGEKVKGMVQVNAFTPVPDTWITKQAVQVWRNARESATAAGLATSPVGLVVLSKANALFQLWPIVMLPPMMDFMRKSPTFQDVSSLTGITTVIPVEVASVMIMNNHIREDNKNKLSFRTEMTPRDVQIIRDAASGNVLAKCPADWPLVAPPPQLAATILKEKMGRDPKYKLTIMLK
ncbi:hypothetical protein C8R45DRAFT_922740 [Mycena sanguinolenta]|nr:hypothetical protein C8R45DRAFT_922740 [Mycena sanguinolenta]